MNCCLATWSVTTPPPPGPYPTPCLAVAHAMKDQALRAHFYCAVDDFGSRADTMQCRAFSGPAVDEPFDRLTFVGQPAYFAWLSHPPHACGQTYVHVHRRDRWRTVLSRRRVSGSAVSRSLLCSWPRRYRGWRLPARGRSRSRSPVRRLRLLPTPAWSSTRR